MLNLKCAVLVTKANDKSSPLTLHLAEAPEVYCKLSFEGMRGQGAGSKRPWGLAGAPTLESQSLFETL